MHIIYMLEGTAPLLEGHLVNEAPQPSRRPNDVLRKEAGMTRLFVPGSQRTTASYQHCPLSFSPWQSWSDFRTFTNGEKNRKPFGLRLIDDFQEIGVTPKLNVQDSGANWLATRR